MIVTIDKQPVNFAKLLSLSRGLPNEIWKDIFSKVIDGDFMDFRNCSLVDRKWNQLADDPMLSKKMIYTGFCFNPSHWNEFCGEGTVSDDEIDKAYASLPNNIDEILKSDCPAFPGYKTIDTHMLVRIPETIKGKPITIGNLGALLKEQLEFFHHESGYRLIENLIVQQEGDKPIKSCWVLMTTDVIPYSRNETYDRLLILVNSLNKKNGQTGYRVSKTVEAIVLLAAEYLRSKKCLFSDETLTYTRCQENVQGYQVVVGGFALSGLRVDGNNYDYDNIGVAGLRDL